MKDFFQSYRRSKIRMYLASFAVAGILSVMIVPAMNGVKLDSRLLQANVLSTSETSTNSYSADLVVERTQQKVVLRMGRDAESVSSIMVTLLGNPEIFSGVHGDEISGVQVTNSEPGVFLVRVDLSGKDVRAGEVLATLSIDLPDDAPLASSDVLLASEGQMYTLSVDTAE